MFISSNDNLRKSRLWRGHAIQLRRLRSKINKRRINKSHYIVFQGSLTQILEWLKRTDIIRDGRFWIEDIAEPARIIHKVGCKEKLRLRLDN